MIHNRTRHALMIATMICGSWLVSGHVRAEPVTAMAMVGTPALGAGFDHLPYADPDARKGGTLRESAIGSFDSLNPWILSGSAPARINLVYDRLMERSWDEPFSIYAALAESIDWDQANHTLLITLNPAARWHDGVPVTSRDVAFTIDTMRKIAKPNTRRVFTLVTGSHIIDDRHIRLDLDPAMDRESLMILAMMTVLPHHYWASRDITKAGLEPPLGSGPYKIARIDPGRRIEFERVSDYWGRDLPVNRGLYNFDHVIVDYFRDDLVALEAFKAGSIDWRQELDAANWAERYDFPARRDGHVTTANIPHHRPAWFKGFIFNTRRPPFDDWRVRRALTEAFDFTWMRHALFRDLYQRLDSTFANSLLAAKGEPDPGEQALLSPFRDQLPEQVFGPAWLPDQFASSRHRQEKIDQWLREAGWVYQKGSRINLRNGQKLAIELLIGNPAEERVALEYGRMLKKLGITLNIRTVDAAQFRQRLDHFDYDMVSWRWINSLSPGIEQSYYWGSAAADRIGGRNYAGVKSAAIDSIAASIPLANDPGQMQTRVHALDRVIMHGYYAVPLYYAAGDWVAWWSDRVTRPQHDALYGMVIEAWMAKE